MFCRSGKLWQVLFHKFLERILEFHTNIIFRNGERIPSCTRLGAGDIQQARRLEGMKKDLGESF